MKFDNMNCFFCGQEMSDATNDPAICTSPLNTMPTDTVGNHHHHYLPKDSREQAALAVERIRKLQRGESQ